LRELSVCPNVKNYLLLRHKITQFMTTTEQIKGIVERLGALRRYL